MRFSLLILTVLLPCLVFAATLSVKQDGSGDYVSIQAALDAADPGDTVLVHPGRYFENLTIQTNGISLISLEATTGNPAYIDSTIIDGTGSMGGIMVGQYKTIISVRGLSVTNGFGAGISLGASSESMVTNCKIFGRTFTIGGGINVGGATVFLSGVDIFNNYALQLGGGLYASEPTGHNTNIIFDSINRCSIYNNRAGAGQDIYIQNATRNLDIPLDTFSVAEPTSYYAIYLSKNPIVANYHIQFDILNAHHQEIDNDLYVSTIGDDANDGLSPASALKTIHEAIYRIAPDSLNLKTVHILPGEYSRTDNDQVFPIALKSWVKGQGSGIDATTVIGESYPQPHENISTRIFSAIMEEAVWLADLSITSRFINRYCVAIGGARRRLSVNLSNLRIYDIRAHETYDGVYQVIDITLTSEHESIWNNITIENMLPAKILFIDNLVGISDSGEITAMRGKFSNCTFRNAISTYSSGSVMGIPLISIAGDKRLEFENCIFENLSVDDDDANVVQIHGIQYPQQQNHFSFDNCLFSNITSHDKMVLIGSANNPRIDISNCTFAGNQGNAYTLMVNGEVNITNSIFDNDTPYQIKVNPMDGNPNEHTHLTIDHSLVKDGIAGILPFPVAGNSIHFRPTSISGDPLFWGGDEIHDPLYYSLSSASPCIDSGSPDISVLDLPPYDLAGNWRLWNRQIDMGSFEYRSEPWVSIDNLVLPSLPETVIAAYPNPFSVFTNIRLSANPTKVNGQPKIGNASISIYNVKGQKVKSIALDPGQKGEQFTAWDGTDDNKQACSNGIYIINLTVNGRSVSSKKVTFIK